MYLSSRIFRPDKSKHFVCVAYRVVCNLPHAELYGLPVVIGGFYCGKHSPSSFSFITSEKSLLFMD